MTNMMSLFFTLVIAHLLGDFALQTNWILQLKQRGGWGIVPHVLVHLLITAMLLQEPRHYWLMFVILGITHYVIDWGKLRFYPGNTVFSFWLDQSIHFAVLSVLATLFSTAQPALAGETLLALFTAGIVAATCIYVVVFPTMITKVVTLPNNYMFSISKGLGGFSVLVAFVFAF